MNPLRLGTARLVQLGWSLSTLGGAIAVADGRSTPYTRVTARRRLEAPSRAVGVALGYNDAKPLDGTSALFNTPRVVWRPPAVGWPARRDPPRDTTRLRVLIRLEVLGLSRDALVGPVATSESTLRYKLDKLAKGWPGPERRAFLAALASALSVEQKALIPGPDWSGLAP